MSARLFDKALEGFLDGGIDWDTNTIKAGLISVANDAGIKVVTAASNTSPIVVAATGHGFSNGDTVVVGGVVGNLAANGVWKIANVAANTFELTTLVDSIVSTGSGAYVSGGYAVNLTAADNWDDLSAAVVSTPGTLANKTVTSGVADADNVAFIGVSGGQVVGLVLYKDTGVESTSRLIHWSDGRVQVTCMATAAISDTSIAVAPLEGAIISGSVIAFSNGVLATLTATASLGARTLTVAALSGGIAAGHQADVQHSGTTLPVTPNGGDIAIQWDNGANRIFRL